MRRLPGPFLLAFALLAGVAAAASAAEPPRYPIRTITLINPAAAGGSNEIIKAVVFDRLAAALGVPIVMESKGGGGGTVGAVAAAAAAPDGYTLLLAGASIIATNPATRKDLGYDPVRDFTPIVTMIDASLMLVVPRNSPARTAREFVDLARAAPGRLNYGSYGPGSASFLAFELFKTIADIDVVHVGYRGGAPLTLALRTGEVQASFDFVQSVRPRAQAGEIRVLGAAAARRSPLLPDVPTLAEQGFPMEAGGVQMLLAPAGLAPEVADRLNAEINRILMLPDVRAKLADAGYEIVGGTRDEAARQIANDLAKWQGLVRRIGFQPQ